MNRAIFCILIAWSATHSWAKDKALPLAPPPAKSAAEPAPMATAWSKGTMRSTRALFPTGSKVKVMGGKEESELERQVGHIPPRERNALFRKVGIETKVAKLDELDKDLLVITAREYSVPNMRKEYPMLSEGQIKKLKEEIGKRK